MYKENEIKEIKVLIENATKESLKYFEEELEKEFIRLSTDRGSGGREKPLNDFIAEAIINADYRKAEEVRKETVKDFAAFVYGLVPIYCDSGNQLAFYKEIDNKIKELYGK